MSEAKDTTKDLATEQVNQISGGSCTAAEAESLISNLSETYENLIEFATYVMERVGGNTTEP